MHDDIIQYQLIKTNRRLTFDITWQREDTQYKGPDDGDYYIFEASNGYQVISRSRMDIQTERLWLLGAKPNERSGSMVFSSNEMRDRAYNEFLKALDEWCEQVRAGKFGWPSNRTPYREAQFLGNEVDSTVDPCPQLYKLETENGQAFLRKVRDCSAPDEADWAFSTQRHPLTDFARLGRPLTPAEAQEVDKRLHPGSFEVEVFRTSAEYLNDLVDECGQGFRYFQNAVDFAGQDDFDDCYEVTVRTVGHPKGYPSNAIVYSRFNKAELGPRF